MSSVKEWSSSGYCDGCRAWDSCGWRSKGKLAYVNSGSISRPSYACIEVHQIVRRQNNCYGFVGEVLIYIFLERFI